jgi:DNA-binding transcriptional LysR family regulator
MDEIELRELRYFIATAEELNFITTTEELNFTRPAERAAAFA